MRKSRSGVSSLLLLAMLMAATAAIAEGASQGSPAGGAGSAAAPPSFKAQVEVVTVDVVAASKDGAPIVGLQKNDFLVMEDGKPQAITSFEAVELPAARGGSAAPPSQAPPVSTNTTSEVRTARTFAVLFDDVQMTPAQAQRAREVVASFITGSTRESDRVLLTATSGRAWWSARMEAGRDDLLAQLDRLDGRRMPETSPKEAMSDYEALRISQLQDYLICERVRRRFLNDGVMPEGNPDLRKMEFLTSCDPLVDARARELYTRVADRTRATLTTLERIMDGMAVARGRKAVILVSSGFVFDQQIEEGRRVVSASRRANAAVYFVDVRGLGVGNEQLFQAHYENPDTWGSTNALAGQASTQLSEDWYEAEGAVGVAADTGGFSVRNANAFEGGLARIADESRAYYLLGYTPRNSNWDGKYRKIEVKTSRKGINVRARRGYFATNQATAGAQPGETPADVRRAADAPFEVDGIGLRAAAYTFEETKPGQARVDIVADIELRQLAFEKIDERYVDSLDLLLSVARREGGKPLHVSESINLKLRPETRGQAGYYPYRKALDLAPGHYQARLVVQDHQGGRVGSVVHDFTVPSLNEWRVASTVLTDMAPIDPQTGQPQVVLVPRREFPNIGTLVCSVQVYGARRDDASGETRVSQGYTLLRDGVEVKRSEPTRIPPSPAAQIGRVFGWSLPSLAPGSYELVLSFVDEVSGQRKQVRESFTVVGAAQAATSGR
jgi:VWFA-related protein